MSSSVQAAGQRPLVVVTPYGRSGGSSRVRIYDWLDHLRLSDEMVEVHDYRGDASNRAAVLRRHPISTLAAEGRTRRVSAAGRRLVVSREASPFSTGRLEARLLREAGHGVYDVDDALFDDIGSGGRALVSKAATWARAVAAADLVVAGNDYLADRASRDAREVVVIPSCVEPGAYPAKTSYAVADPPRLIWVGSPSTERHLLGIAASLLEVHHRTGARVQVVSAGDASLGPLEALADRATWDAQTVAARLCAADLAVGPLPDSAYARGKCAYKLLQYAAVGLPTVASPVGANATALRLLGGCAATSASEWVDAIVALLAAPEDNRAHLGSLARRRVTEHYSFARWAPQWRTAVLP